MDDRASERRAAAGIGIWGNRREFRVPNAPVDGQCLTEKFRRGKGGFWYLQEGDFLVTTLIMTAF